MHDLVIIGAGPAGLAAALYAGRFRLKTLIFEKLSAGGQIILSSEIENYPGFPAGISTYELIERFKKQVQELGLTIENEEALEIVQGQLPAGAASDKVYGVRTANKTYEAKSVIIATGASPKRLGVPGEDKFLGRGVSYCGTCDGPLFRDKDVIAVGGGDRAIEEAIFLSGYAKKVYLVHRRREFRASKILIEKARSKPNINLALDSVIEEISGENKVEKVKIKNTRTGALGEIVCQGVFMFVGIQPNTAFLKNILEMDELGFIITDHQMLTSKEAIFACGDCRKKSLYQVVTATSDGAIAADSAHKYLLNR
jgi:thioredoxin reductase (NADPH)